MLTVMMIAQVHKCEPHLSWCWETYRYVYHSFFTDYTVRFKTSVTWK